MADKDCVIATLAIGFADGLERDLSNAIASDRGPAYGKGGSVCINGTPPSYAEPASAERPESGQSLHHIQARDHPHHLPADRLRLGGPPDLPPHRSP